MYDDTIAAISTAVGDAGIGIVRVSGQDAVPILRRIFRPATTSGNIGKGLVPFRSDDSDRASWRASLPASRTVEGDRATRRLKPAATDDGPGEGWSPESHRAYYGRTVDPATGQEIDEAIALCMLAPRS